MKCFECGGDIVEKDVSFVMYAKDKKPIFFEDVCAGVCVQCGEKYLDGHTLEHINNILKEGEGEITRKITIPVASLACAHH